ncbi:MAG: NAD(P)H-dependent oxidoreductase subunit E [Deltaproteobacteria bacterium]|nr:NAD(P)H-dependent oxidoreductase subunit E [Deltaproteobacteria bacterium]
MGAYLGGVSDPICRDLSDILRRHHQDPTRLIQILHDVMAVEGWISKTTITELSRALGLPRGQVEGVVGFYSFFLPEPSGQFRVLFSDNITDEHQGSRALLRTLAEALEVEPGQVRADGRVKIGLTSCTGLCDQGPALLVKGRAIGRLTPERLSVIAGLIESNTPIEQWPPDLFHVESHFWRRDLLLSTPCDPGAAMRALEARGSAATMAELGRSDLRGRGGAGFNTAAKWTACAAAPGPERYIVCNADEGEPGTFKDRELLAHYAHQVIEGMTIAARLVSAQRGFLYLRAEYQFLIAPLLAAFAERRSQGLLGPNILGISGFDFDIELHLGAGAYVCGEESALLESLEGKRGIPRNRPPYPVTHGYLNKPTVLNNVETFLAAAQIALHGAEWFCAVGTPKSRGTKILSVAGDVERPGTYEFPFGTTIRAILDEAGAKGVQAVQVSGPAGMLLSASELDRKLAFEDVPSAGSVMAFDQSRDLLGVTQNFVRFFAHESCGFCTPCRVGTTLNRQRMDRIVSGHGTRHDVEDLESVARLMRASSHCGLGHFAANPVVDLLRKFRPKVDRRLASLEVLPSFDLDAALGPARELTGRDDAGAHLSEEGP